MPVNPFASCLVIGSTRSGKTTMVKRLLSFYRTWRIIVLSDTAQFNHEYDFILDYPKSSSSHHNEILPITEQSWDRIKDIVKDNETIAKNAGRSPEVFNKYRTVLLLDDAVSREMDHVFLDTLLSRARHVYFKVVISTQAVQASIKPLGRFNIAILFLSSNVSSETATYTYPMSGASPRVGIRSKRQFIDFVEQNARPFYFLRFSAADPSVPPRLIESTRLRAVDTIIQN